MKLYLTFLTIIITNSSCYAQSKIIFGEVKDSKTKQVLKYVSIGILNKSVGTVSDSNGRFTIKLNEKVLNTDTLIFSSIGYVTKKYTISDLSDINLIELYPEEKYLADVLVKSTKRKPKIIGRNNKGLGLMHLNFYTAYEKTIDDRLSKEIGMKFRIKKDCKISDLNFNVTSNDFKLVKFRLNFYTIENGFPTNLFIEKNIVFEIKDQFLGWYNLDLKSFQLYLGKENEEIAVTIQWIESQKKNEKSKYFAISTAMSATEHSFYREKAMDKWLKSGQSLSFYLNAMCK